MKTRDFTGATITMTKTTISVTRYGNVMMSRGSVIPLFIDQILEGKEVNVTDSQMTRFLMSLQDSMHLVLQAFTNAQPGDLFVKKAPASNLETLVNGLCLVLGVENVKTNTIGIRHGEKLHDTLLTTEELARSSNTEAFFSVPTDNRSLNYRKYTEEGENPSNTSPSVYDSSSTNQLNATEVAALIESLPEFQVHMGRK